MFRVKICGVTSSEDARLAVSAGADAIGLNFYVTSPRFVSTDLAARIAAAVGNSAACVGVFVNESPDRINEIASGLDLDWVQLHGDEPPEFPTKISESVKIIRACRLSAESPLEAMSQEIATCQAAGRAPAALLVDAVRPGVFGGTGERLDWQRLAGFRSHLGTTPLVLAGGLNPDNVCEAIRVTRPDAVDVASGVESRPGVKDYDLMRQFLQSALEALNE